MYSFTILHFCSFCPSRNDEQLLKCVLIYNSAFLFISLPIIFCKIIICILKSFVCKNRRSWIQEAWMQFFLMNCKIGYPSQKLNTTLFFYIAGVNKNKTTAASSTPSKISHHLATFGSSNSEDQKQIETSGFSTKDSSDSKSHDSGIDSIEKPGRYQ